MSVAHSAAVAGIESARKTYITMRPYNNDIYTYTSERLIPVISATASNCPQGRFLRETGRRLYPNTHPGVSTMMVGVFDNVTSLNGIIDPLSFAFTPQTTDRPYFVDTNGFNPNTGDFPRQPDLGPPVYTQGDIYAAGNEHVNGSVEFMSTLSVAANTNLLSDLYVAGGLVGSASIGDSNILWQAYTGGSQLSGGTLANNATFANTDQGVRLNSGTSTNGQFYWRRSYVPSQNIIINATLLSTQTGVNPGDATNIFIGAQTLVTSSASGIGTSGIVIVINEHGSDLISVLWNGVLKGSMSTFPTIGAISNGTIRNFNFIIQNTVNGILVTVEASGIYMGTVNIGTGITSFPGTFVGINGWAGSDSSAHYVKTFSVKSARAWELLKY